MSNNKQDPLGNLLRQWAERNKPTETDIERLRERVTQAVRNEPFLDVPPPSPPRCRTLGFSLWFSLGAAVAVLLVPVLRPAGEQSRPVAVHQEAVVAQEDQPQTPPLVQFQQTHLAEKARLLAGMEEMFNGRLAWVAEHGREVELGILPDAASPSRDAKPMVVRVVVLARKSGEPGWKPIWQTDVIAQDEEVVDLAANGTQDGSKLRLWMHSLPDGAIAVDADLVLRGGRCLQSSFSGIQRAGVPQRVFLSQDDGTEYEVYQTVAPLQTKGNS